MEQALEKLRQTAPLVQSITNYVVMNNTANALLAVGASPIMAHAHKEVRDMVSIVHALVVNIGTLDDYWVESMALAAQHALELGKPWVLDPVGAGATPYRNEVLGQLIAFKPTVIRGNASEILSLANVAVASRGVDSANRSEEAVDAGRQLATQFDTVVCISGASDFVIDRHRTVRIENGHEWMPRVTGMGCTASVMIGAFLGAEEDPFEATVNAMTVMGVAGELAAEKSTGPGSLQLHFYDALFSLTDKQLLDRAKLTRNEPT
ncbi:Hydroxyethylthiazole kinase [Lunatimonas lonarensis]|uniref:Hydroxyethylthiazole kinase n=1 Tax=Lunatimonas lonarensis TaxID=1232681 RepID=R7ZM14_9BACT|nr:hydroxyethylthiazole kinase [Lunatimonas lonarensis]EON75135.1 Hydroxyethylthiazole kinase [Lunatimonas lonarensis]